MKDRTHRARRSDCPINVALEALGDGWSLLIVRDLMFKDRRTFTDFLRAEEGIASNILTDRLARLEALGLVSKRPDPDDARRHVYRLTEAGIELAPVLVELVVWSARHFSTAAPSEVLEAMTQHRRRFLADVRRRWARDGEAG